MKYAISLVLATFLTSSLGFALNQTVVNTHHLEQANE